jgi:tetratricopeptide (TPR) repeat protein
MILDWFNTRQVTQLGCELADQFASQAKQNLQSTHGDALKELFARADREVRGMPLNVYKKAKFANSFKWRLLENGVDKESADEVTQRLVMHLSGGQDLPAPSQASTSATAGQSGPTGIKSLLAQGNKCMARGAYEEATVFYQDLVNLNPRHAVALNNLGSALCKLGRYAEAEEDFRAAIRVEPDYPDAHGNLGTLLRWKGHMVEAEASLRRALKLKPNFVDARTSLGLTMVLIGRLRDARARFDKVLKVSRGNADALVGMGQVAAMEGRFDESKALFERALTANPSMPAAWAALAGIRKMTAADGPWLQAAEKVAAAPLSPLEGADIRYAMGKYYDDIRDFERAFENYKRANELQKTVAEPYDKSSRKHFVDDLIRVFTPAAVAGSVQGASASLKPVFIIGMMRSGTSLAEQIIASHPSVKGAGELQFWSDAMQEHEAALRQGPLSEEVRIKLADAYLRAISIHSADAQHIVDKTPVNSDYLGVIHSVFPNARFIYMQRNAIDTCLSCYFQQFSPALNFAMDLSDLAHYYREHQRLMAHWRAVLPPDSILDVPYEGLVADQESWTRRILDFLGLEWDERCLDFYSTKRPVATASTWQVRQKMYTNSVQRWRNYEKFINPLLSLRDLNR